MTKNLLEQKGRILVILHNQNPRTLTGIKFIQIRSNFFPGCFHRFFLLGLID
jgi:hypothetical protein